MSPRRSRRAKRGRRLVLLVALVVLGLVNVPTMTSAVKRAYEDYRIETHGYKQRMGHWDELPVPPEFRLNSVHAALLHTGKVLLIAGSGNDEKAFRAGTFKTLLWDPRHGTFRLIHTPSDMFCAGHAFLPDGRLLIAGGTTRYEVLKEEVTHAAGPMTVTNAGSGRNPVVVDKGTLFSSASGVVFRATSRKRVPAQELDDGKLVPGVREVWVEAVRRGRGSLIEHPTSFSVTSHEPTAELHARADRLTLDQQDPHGTRRAYVFDPIDERYERVGDMKIARWYPSLVQLSDGKVLALSGLDEFGRIVPGHNEVYDPKSQSWTLAPELERTLPTYPSVFLLEANRLFYSGSNAGYGDAEIGHTPGVWNVDDNTFDIVHGLRDLDQTQTSGSVWLPPAQRQRFMVAGGGGDGDSRRSTARVDIADLSEPEPRFEAGPDLPAPTRYPNLVITPDDKVVITGGSRGYRGKGDSNLLLCHLYDPKSNRITRLADPHIGRNYHSAALLLPDGRIMTMGSDSLYNRDDTRKGEFERRIEIYSPSYLHRGERPALTAGPSFVRRGETATFLTPTPRQIMKARLMRPSAVTHVTDLEQRSVALPVTRRHDAVELGIPSERGLLPDGWHMLYVIDGDGIPSIARWVHVT